MYNGSANQTAAFAFSILSRILLIKIRLWAQDFYCVIVDEGTAQGHYQT